MEKEKIKLIETIQDEFYKFKQIVDAQFELFDNLLFKLKKKELDRINDMLETQAQNEAERLSELKEAI